MCLLIVLDKDECKTESHGCQQKCVNQQGSYFCACINGYQLNKDNKTCSGKVSVIGFKDVLLY